MRRRWPTWSLSREAPSMVLQSGLNTGAGAETAPALSFEGVGFRYAEADPQHWKAWTWRLTPVRSWLSPGATDQVRALWPDWPMVCWFQVRVRFASKGSPLQTLPCALIFTLGWDSFSRIPRIR